MNEDFRTSHGLVLKREQAERLMCQPVTPARITRLRREGHSVAVNELGEVELWYLRDGTHDFTTGRERRAVTFGIMTGEAA